MLRKSIDKEKVMCYIVVAKTQQGGAEMQKKRYSELNKLKGLMVEKKETYRSLSKKSGIPLNTLNSKLNGYSLFDITETLSVCSILEIAPAEIPIFFT